MDEPVELITGHGSLGPRQMAIILILRSFLRMLLHPFLLELIRVIFIVLQAVTVVSQELLPRMSLLVVLG